MSISFNEIPSANRVPLFYAEFDNSAAISGNVTQLYNILLMGNKLAAGTGAALTPYVITSLSQAKSLFGNGSQIAEMAEYYLENNNVNELTCLAFDDLVAGVQAEGTLTITGPSTGAGTISLLVGGKDVKVGVSSGQTSAQIATAIAAAINAKSELLVSAVANASDVELTCKHKGVFGNDIDVRHSHYEGEVLPAGVTVAVVAMSGGTGNPDVDTAWAALGDKHYILVGHPYNDTSSLDKIEAEFTGRFGPIEAIDAYGLVGKRGTFSAIQTLGNARNSQFTNIWESVGPTSPWAKISEVIGKIAASGSIDPARPFHTLELKKTIAPKQSERFTWTERNLLLYSGISTTTVNPGGKVMIEGAYTTYKLNSFGSPDQSYSGLNTLLTLSYLRFDLKARLTSRFPRHKLASDGTRFSPGQAIVTPSSIKAEVVAKFREWESAGLVENFSQFKKDLIVEIDSSNPNRVNILLPPDLVNQLIVIATRIQFKL